MPMEGNLGKKAMDTVELHRKKMKTQDLDNCKNLDQRERPCEFKLVQMEQAPGIGRPKEDPFRNFEYYEKLYDTKPKE